MSEGFIGRLGRGHENAWSKPFTSDVNLNHVVAGDIDGIVPLVGTRRWIKSLGLSTLEPWRPYTSATGVLCPTPTQLHLARYMCATSLPCALCINVPFSHDVV